MVTSSSFTFLCCLTVLFEGNLCDLNLIAFATLLLVIYTFGNYNVQAIGKSQVNACFYSSLFMLNCSYDNVCTQHH